MVASSIPRAREGKHPKTPSAQCLSGLGVFTNVYLSEGKIDINQESEVNTGKHVNY